jgi:hypothetical protein
MVCRRFARSHPAHAFPGPSTRSHAPRSGSNATVSRSSSHVRCKAENRGEATGMEVGLARPGTANLTKMWGYPGSQTRRCHRWQRGSHRFLSANHVRAWGSPRRMQLLFRVARNRLELSFRWLLHSSWTACPCRCDGRNRVEHRYAACMQSPPRHTADEGKGTAGLWHREYEVSCCPAATSSSAAPPMAYLSARRLAAGGHAQDHKQGVAAAVHHQHGWSGMRCSWVPTLFGRTRTPGGCCAGGGCQREGAAGSQ